MYTRFNERSQLVNSLTSSLSYTLLTKIVKFNNKVNYNFDKKNSDDISKIKSSFFKKINKSPNRSLKKYRYFGAYINLLTSCSIRHGSKGGFLCSNPYAAKKLVCSIRTIISMRNILKKVGVLTSIAYPKGGFSNGKPVSSHLEIDFERLTEFLEAESIEDMSPSLSHLQRSQLLGKITKKYLTGGATFAHYIHSTNILNIEAKNDSSEWWSIGRLSFLTREIRTPFLKSVPAYLAQKWTEYLGINVTTADIYKLRYKHISERLGYISYFYPVPPSFGQDMEGVYHVAA